MHCWSLQQPENYSLYCRSFAFIVHTRLHLSRCLPRLLWAIMAVSSQHCLHFSFADGPDRTKRHLENRMYFTSTKATLDKCTIVKNTKDLQSINSIMPDLLQTSTMHSYSMASYNAYIHITSTLNNSSFPHMKQWKSLLASLLPLSFDLKLKVSRHSAWFSSTFYLTSLWELAFIWALYLLIYFFALGQ